jgi:hypothetical protein
MSETPYSPADQPGDDDWTSHAPQGQPRYAASASVPPPPAPPAGPAFGQPPASGFGQPPASGFGQPPASGFGQPPASGFGQPPAPGFGQPGQGGAAPGQNSVGQARVAASASVPATPANYGPPPQGYPSQPGVYGTPGGQSGPPAPAGQQYGSAAPATYGQPAQGFGQAPPGSGFGQPGHAPGGSAFGGQTFPPGPGGPGGHGAPGGPSGPGGAGGGQFGQPNQGHGGPPPGFNAPSYNQGYQGEQDRGRDYDDEPAASSGRGPRRGFIIAGLIAAVLIVVVGIGGFVGYKLTNRSADYAVGTCVVKDDTSAKAVDCATGGAYKITSLEDAVSKCPDIFQPSLALPSAPAEHRYACLSPMSAN